MSYKWNWTCKNFTVFIEKLTMVMEFVHFKKKICTGRKNIMTFTI